MGKIARDLTGVGGGTPLLEASRFSRGRGLSCRLLCKLEYLNPAGSVKDRVALWMLRGAEKSGVLKPGATIIEPTSGNTGIGLAAMGVALGYKVVLTMPETMSQERRDLLKSVRRPDCPDPRGTKGWRGPLRRPRSWRRPFRAVLSPASSTIPRTPQAHYDTTGPELWEQSDGELDVVCGGHRHRWPPSPGPAGFCGRSGFHPAGGCGARGVPCTDPGQGWPSWTARYGCGGLCLRCWIPAFTTRCFPVRRIRPTLLPGSLPRQRASWWGFPLALLCGRLAKWRPCRRTRGNPSGFCCRIPATGISPRNCSKKMLESDSALQYSRRNICKFIRI